MIRAHVSRTVSEQVTDYLGGDPVLRGEERTGVYPGVEVIFYDDTIGGPENEQARLGIASYILRPRSNLETMEDVKDKVAREIARLTAEAGAKSPSPAVTPLNQAALDALSVEVGKEIRRGR